MSPLFRVQALISRTWYTTYANPSLLVFGFLISIITLSLNSSLFPYTEALTNGFPENIFRIFSPFFLAFILLGLLCKTLASSQIFILAASEFLQRPTLLTFRHRFRSAFVYAGIEIFYTLLLIFAFILLALPSISEKELAGPFSSIIINISLVIFFIIAIFTTIIKHLVVGYFFLSPIRLRSSLQLSTKLFVRYQYFSFFSFLFILLFSLLFTILENLVMLQYVFIERFLPGIAPETFIYTALLFAYTFVSVFSEVFWLHFFLLLTNKKQKSTNSLPLLQKELGEVSPIPSQKTFPLD